MNTPYSLIPVSILVLFLYAVSFLMSRGGVYKKSTHRKLWNTLLLATFLVTGILGITLVIKINYKLDIPFYDTILKYHVEFGIGMFIIALFHFFWHIDYYMNLFNKNKKKITLRNIPSIDNSKNKLPPSISLKLTIFFVGFTTIITQIVLLREFLSVFNGNELVVGIVLGNWMIITAIGAYIGKYSLKIKNHLSAILFSLFLISILPVVTAFLINYLKNIVFPPGLMVNIFQVFYSSFLIIFPFCVISGILFTLTSKYISEKNDENLISTIYTIESIGSIVGGLLFSFLLIFIFSAFQSLNILMIVNGIGIILISWKNPSRFKYTYSVLAIVIAIFCLSINLEKIARTFLFTNQEVIESKATPYGNLVVTSKAGQFNTYNNNVILFNTGNEIQAEEAVHYAMIQHANPKNILLLSGGLSGQLKELLKYNIKKIDYVEFNKWFVALLKDSVNELKSDNVQLILKDPRLFIKQTKNKYDVAILNLPEPSTIHANRYYTVEFFAMLKERLNPGGIISFGFLSGANYMNQEAIDLSSTIYNTLKSIFKKVIVIPGEKNYYISSDSTINYHITRKIDTLGIDNNYVNLYYIDDKLLEMRGNLLLEDIKTENDVNRDLTPVSYQQQLNYWLTHFKGKYRFVAIITILLVLLILFRSSVYSKAMFVTGFSASGLELIILFGLQILLGNIYYLTGLIFTAFMAGLAIGARYSQAIIPKFTKKYLAFNQYIIGLFAIITMLLIAGLNQIDVSNGMIYGLFFLLTILIGVLTGLEFSMVSKLQKGSYGEISGRVYSFDLIGSAVGAMVVTIYIVPVIGIIYSLVCLGILNILFGLYLSLYKN